MHYCIISIHLTTQTRAIDWNRKSTESASFGFEKICILTYALRSTAGVFLLAFIRHVAFCIVVRIRRIRAYILQ